VKETGIETMLVGGAMICPQGSTVQQQLGPLATGIVNDENWLPTSPMAFSGSRELIAKYQLQAQGSQADALGYYVAPFAYALLQVVEQAIRGTDGLVCSDLAEFTHTYEFHTVVGDVRFGPLGECDKPHVLSVQFQHLFNDIEEFRGLDARVVMSPPKYSSGSRRTFEDAKNGVIR
jgi:branched-chain amino acid transport system substrate-binding protein